MRGKIFKEIDILDKKKKLASILTRVSKNKLTEEEINHIVENIDIGRQYGIECISNPYAYKEAITMTTNIKFDAVNGSSGNRMLLHDVLLLDKRCIVNKLDEIDSNINELKKGLYIIDDGKFIIGLDKFVGMYNGTDVLSEETETVIPKLDITKNVCVVSEYMEWDHTDSEKLPTNKMKLLIFVA